MPRQGHVGPQGSRTTWEAPGLAVVPAQWAVLLVGTLPLRAEHPFSCLVQLIFPDLVEGLVLMNIDPNGKGWIDWAAAKVSRTPNSSKLWWHP